jgi:hypothetical protein
MPPTARALGVPTPPPSARGAPTAPPQATRQVRRVATRQAQRHQERAAVHPALSQWPALPALPVSLPVWQGANDVPVYEAVLGWLDVLLAGSGHTRPARKRLALLGAALLAAGGEHGTPAGITRTAFGLQIGTATQEASVARRVMRLLDDPHLDPHRLLPDLTRTLLPVLLAEVVGAHAHTIGTTPAHATHAMGHHGRWVGLRLVVDESVAADGTHVLAVGLAYRGTVVPLGLRTWPQNVALPEGAYWAALGTLLWEVHATLPPQLRAHVLLLADRGYGVPAFLDLLAALGWQWVVRVQGQVRVRFPDGTSRALRTLVPRAGTTWTGSTTATPTPTPTISGSVAPPTPTTVAVFKKAGWRHVRVVAVWATGQEEPWLLVTSLAAAPATARCAEYAVRWCIERLFLSWKSHGWDLDACGVGAPARVARLLGGYVIATWWLLAAALPGAHAHLADLASRATRRTGLPPTRSGQLRLCLFPLARPLVAKSSLLTQGRRAFAGTDCRTATPILWWLFPDWDAPTWSRHCLDVSHARSV